MSRRVARTRNALRLPRFFTVFVAVLAVAIGTVVPLEAATASTSVAASTSLARSTSDIAQTGIVKTSLTGFAPGNIISDAVFTNSGTMTEAQIQSFLNAKVSKCVVGKDEDGKPFVCLKDLKIPTQSKAADAYCKAYAGASSESAARILYKVGKACNINPQVLIVMLQKEQGLVTHVWPSNWRYNKAMGQACPDTAPCDTAFAGFFAQVYGAARQMQIYMEGKYFQWYAPGKTWGILYHPNASCGRGNVYVANKATAALYYYTPYQPNAAALRANYGEGDGCSSYGNRNFYNYFTDWFGSTQNPTSTQGLVKVGTQVWLLSGTNRYHITAEAYPQYKPVLGAPTVVSSSVLTPYKVGAQGSFFVKNASTGVVAMLDGTKTHRFPTCAMVAQWGGECGAALVTMTNAHFAKFGAGAEMTTFGRLAANGRIHQISGSSLVPLYDAASVAARNGGKAPTYSAIFPEAAIKKYKVETRVRFAPGTFVKASNAPEVWLADDAGALHHLPSWPLAAELGLPSKVGTTVTASDLSTYSRGTPLSTFVQCGGKNHVAAGGKLSVLNGPVPGGFSAVGLDATTCARLSLSGTKLSGNAVFFSFSGTPTVYHLVAGTYRAVADAAQRTAINNGLAPTVLMAQPAYQAKVSIGEPYPAPATFVRVNGTPEVWLVDAGTLVHLPSWAMAAEYGLPSSSKIVSAAAVQGMTKRDSLTSFATCGSGTYVAASGKLYAIAKARLNGNIATALSPTVCAGRTSGTALDSPVFLSDGLRTSVATGGGFLPLPDQASIQRAAAGAAVTVRKVSAAYLDRLPKAEVPGQGALVRASNESAVTLINGDVRQRIPNWGVAADLGVQARYEIRAPQELAPRGIGTNDLSVFVKCGSTVYVGSQGTIHALAPDALGGFVPSVLTDSACNTLKRSTQPPITLLRITSSDGQVYGLEKGKLVPVPAQGTTPAGSAVTLQLDARTIAGLRG